MSQPFRLTGEPDEDAIHLSVKALLELVVLPPACWSCFPAGQVQLPPAAAAKLYRMGLQPGWPDFLLVHRGQIYGLELKTKTGTMTYDRIVRTKSGAPRVIVGQRTTFPKLRESGMIIAICRSVDAVLEQLRQWGFPLRATTQSVGHADNRHVGVSTL